MGSRKNGRMSKNTPSFNSSRKKVRSWNVKATHWNYAENSIRLRESAHPKITEDFWTNEFNRLVFWHYLFAKWFIDLLFFNRFDEFWGSWFLVKLICCVFETSGRLVTFFERWIKIFVFIDRFLCLLIDFCVYW